MGVVILLTPLVKSKLGSINSMVHSSIRLDRPHVDTKNTTSQCPSHVIQSLWIVFRRLNFTIFFRLLQCGPLLPFKLLSYKTLSKYTDVTDEEKKSRVSYPQQRKKECRTAAPCPSIFPLRIISYPILLAAYSSPASLNHNAFNNYKILIPSRIQDKHWTKRKMSFLTNQLPVLSRSSRKVWV